jgi:hypothetical protein
LVKQNIPLKSLDHGPVLPAEGGTVRQVAKIVQGVASEKAKEMVRAIKDAKMKVSPSIQGDQLRVTGRSKDELQQAMALLRGPGFRHRPSIREFPVTRIIDLTLWIRWLKRAALVLMTGGAVFSCRSRVLFRSRKSGRRQANSVRPRTTRRVRSPAGFFSGAPNRPDCLDCRRNAPP